MKKMFKILLVVLVLYVILVLILFLNQEKLIFQGVKLNADYTYQLKENFEEVNLKTSDNQTINCVYIKAQNPKGVLLYFHGNKGNLERWTKITSYFTQFNYDVFVMDYRSYGKSSSNPNEELMYDDATMCYDYIKKKFPENNIIVYGRSLGCAFAVKVASENQPKQLILEAPFYNLTDVAKKHYPLIPYKWLLKYKFESDKYMDKVNCKTTFFHGTNDRVIPLRSGKKLYDKSNKKLSKFITINNGTHHNLMHFDTYKAKIKKLLD